MTQVSLKPEAYLALRKVRRPGESFSDAVLRLLQEHQAQARDPWRFVRGKRRRLRTLPQRLAEVEAWRDADRVSRR